MTGEGFWITPEGRIIALEYHEKHIDIIRNNPEISGIESGYFLSVYKKHNEDIFQNKEGNAREEIILEVVKKGWIRVRHYLKPKDYYSLNIESLNEANKKNIKYFAERALLGDKAYFSKPASKHAVMEIKTFDKIIYVTFEDAAKALFPD